LTRVTDKRKVRHDLADIFCTSNEGVRGQRAVDWKFVDAIAKPAVFAQTVAEHAKQLAATSQRDSSATGVALTPLNRAFTEEGVTYTHVQVSIDRAKRVATFTVKAPSQEVATDAEHAVQLGAQFYPLQLARELDDAILHMRTNETDIGLWLMKTSGDAAQVLAMDAFLAAHQTHWFIRQTIGALRRTLSRVDVSSRSLFALIDEGTCFAGTLLELALACDRTYQLILPDTPEQSPKVAMSEANFGFYPMATDQSRLARRFYDDASTLANLKTHIGEALDGDQAQALGLNTAALDDIDWADEIRLAREERVAMSPDALTGLEANLRFNGTENMFTRVFGRLTAWQNWIFQRPNAVGDKGALKVYGKGDKAAFDWNRV
jgi:benzoyl-CoA-dihydrodiol lyase